MKTSLTDPLRIAAVSPPDTTGVIGRSLSPGKKDPSRDWDRDLDIDLTAIRQWGAEVVVTLVERHDSSFSTWRRCPRPSRGMG
jgi:hypothetical protein